MKLTSTHTPYTFSVNVSNCSGQQGFGSVIGRESDKQSLATQYKNHKKFSFYGVPIIDNYITSLENAEEYALLAQIRDIPQPNPNQASLYFYQINYTTPTLAPMQKEKTSPESLMDQEQEGLYEVMKDTIFVEEQRIAKRINGVFINDINERYPDVDPNDGDVEEMQHA